MSENNSIRGKYKDALGSTDEFLRQKEKYSEEDIRALQHRVKELEQQLAESRIKIAEMQRTAAEGRYFMSHMSEHEMLECVRAFTKRKNNHDPHN